MIKVTYYFRDWETDHVEGTVSTAFMTGANYLDIMKLGQRLMRQFAEENGKDINCLYLDDHITKV